MTDLFVLQFMKPGYEPGDGSMDGAMLVDGEWWHPVFGCDSLQMVVDRARAALAQPEPEPANGEVAELVAEQLPDLRRRIESVVKSSRAYDGYSTMSPIQLADRIIDAVVAWIPSITTNDA